MPSTDKETHLKPGTAKERKALLKQLERVAVALKKYLKVLDKAIAKSTGKPKTPQEIEARLEGIEFEKAALGEVGEALGTG